LLILLIHNQLRHMLGYLIFMHLCGVRLSRAQKSCLSSAHLYCIGDD
jgi:hypothetical protein